MTKEEKTEVLRNALVMEIKNRIIIASCKRKAVIWTNYLNKVDKNKKLPQNSDVVDVFVWIWRNMKCIRGNYQKFFNIFFA